MIATLECLDTLVPSAEDTPAAEEDTDTPPAMTPTEVRIFSSQISLVSKNCVDVARFTMFDMFNCGKC